MKFAEEMAKLQKQLERLDHSIAMPVVVPDVDYWSKTGDQRSQAKARLNLIAEHFHRITESDAILVANFSKPDLANYIGANTFAEILMAHCLGKLIYLLNPIPEQPYIIEELQAIAPVILDGNLEKIPFTRDGWDDNIIIVPMG